MKNKKPKLTPVEHETNYVAFLKARLESENYKAVATAEELAETQMKYEKAKFKLKMLLQQPPARKKGHQG
jgi:hypothetical protein